MSDILQTTIQKLFLAIAKDILIVIKLTVILHATSLLPMKKNLFFLKKINILKKKQHRKKKTKQTRQPKTKPLFYGKNSNDIKRNSFLLMNFHYVLPFCPKHYGIIKQPQINAGYPVNMVEFKVKVLQRYK